MINNNINIRHGKCLLLMFFVLTNLVVFGQTRTIRGTVTASEDSEKLIGTSVLVPGTTIGTTTDLDGNFTLKVDEKAKTLKFSMIGYKRAEVSNAGKTVVNVQLETDSRSLDAIVVTGYSKQKKADLTGAVTVVDVTELKKVAANNPIQALQGRAAGVDITNDGSPSGSGTTVRIRGIGTLNNNDPLYIIDGVATKSGMHELNSSDIESIQVLRDASAASIYGSRAGNGVIIITTQKGKSGKVKVNFDSYLST